MEESNQRFELLCKRQQQLDLKREQFWKEEPYSNQRWNLLLKEQQNLNELFHEEQQNSLERLRKSISYLAEVVLEKYGVSNASSVASQVFDGNPVRKLEVTDPYLQVPERKLELADPYLQGNYEATAVVSGILSSTDNDPQVFDEMPQRNFGSLDKPYQLFDEMPQRNIDSLDKPYQLFDEIPERKLEVMDSCLLSNKENVVESSPLRKQTTTADAHQSHSEALKLPMRKESYHPKALQAALGQATNEMEGLQPKSPLKHPITTIPWRQNTPINLKPNPTFRSPINPIHGTQNNPNKANVKPGTNLLAVGIQKTLENLCFATNESQSVGQTVEPPSYNQVDVMGSSLSRSTTPYPQLVAKVLSLFFASNRQRRPFESENGGINDSKSPIGVCLRVRAKELWLLSTVNKVLEEFSPRLSHEANGLSFQEVSFGNCRLLYPFERGKTRLMQGLKVLILASDKTDMQAKGFGLDVFRVRISSSSSTFIHSPTPSGGDTLTEVYKWGVIMYDNSVNVGADNKENSLSTKADVLLPKPLHSNPYAHGKFLCWVEDNLSGESVEEVAYHIDVLTSMDGEYTWGNGANESWRKTRAALAPKDVNVAFGMENRGINVRQVEINEDRWHEIRVLPSNQLQIEELSACEVDYFSVSIRSVVDATVGDIVSHYSIKATNGLPVYKESSLINSTDPKTNIASKSKLDDTNIKDGAVNFASLYISSSLLTSFPCFCRFTFLEKSPIEKILNCKIKPRDFISFLPVFIGTIVHYFSAEATCITWNPVPQKRTYWPSMSVLIAHSVLEATIAKKTMDFQEFMIQDTCLMTEELKKHAIQQFFAHGLP